LEDHPLDDSLRLVESQETCGNFALRRHWFYQAAENAKTILPTLHSGMKEPNGFSRSAVDRCHV
jgi:hypothetical protein